MRSRPLQIVLLVLVASGAAIAAVTSRIDAAIMTWLAAHQHARLTVAFRSVYVLGDEIVAGCVVVVCLMILAWHRRWRDMFALAIATGGILAWVDLVFKPLVDRRRPPEMLLDAAGRSFPSGHAAGNLVLYLLLATLLGARHPRRAPWLVAGAWCWAVLQGLSSIYVRAHYPTDVLGGLAIGLIWLTAVLAWRGAVHHGDCSGSGETKT